MELAFYMIEAEFLLPLTDSIQAAIACTWALGKLMGGQAQERLKRLSASADPRIRLYVAKCRAEDPIGPLYQECRLAPSLDNEPYFSSMRTNLADAEEECRFEFLELALRRPAAEIFAYIAALLTDSSQRVRMRAAEYLKIGATRDEAQLRSLFPALEYSRHPQTELSESEDLSIRTWAIESLYFDHQSELMQEKLLSVFDRPELGAKKALTKAFCCCPNKARLKEEMLERLRNACPENRISACYVLGTLQDPSLRPHFLAVLEEEPALACAGIHGLFHVMEATDAAEIQRCQARWGPISLY